MARWNGKGISARYFPILLALLMAALGLALVVQSFLVDTRKKGGGAYSCFQFSALGRVIQIPAPLIPIVMTFVFLLVVDWLGFILTASVMICTILLILRPGRYLQSIVISVGFSAAIYYAFYYGFQIYLPAGFGQ